MLSFLLARQHSAGCRTVLTRFVQSTRSSQGDVKRERLPF